MVAELRAPVADKLEITLSLLIERADQIFKRAMAAGQFNAAIEQSESSSSPRIISWVGAVLCVGRSATGAPPVVAEAPPASDNKPAAPSTAFAPRHLQGALHLKWVHGIFHTLWT
jgi:hypothetical protein